MICLIILTKICFLSSFISALLCMKLRTLLSCVLRSLLLLGFRLEQVLRLASRPNKVSSCPRASQQAPQSFIKRTKRQNGPRTRGKTEPWSPFPQTNLNFKFWVRLRVKEINVFARYQSFIGAALFAALFEYLPCFVPFQTWEEKNVWISWVGVSSQKGGTVGQ